MKKGLFGSTALIGATAMMAGAAGAAEAPTWKLSGNMNFQAYFADRDAFDAIVQWTSVFDTTGGFVTVTQTGTDTFDTTDFYFGVDESELQLNVSGTADNGLNYGFKIEINANTDDGTVADEARLQLSGGWGTVQLGDEDGAEDIMNYGGESLLGASGAWDGDGDDVASSIASVMFPTMAGDTSDSTKVSYFSPRFSGFQVGASYTPTRGDGNVTTGQDGVFQNYFGLGANYDNSFGDLRVRASAVYAMASYEGVLPVEDIGAYSVGGIVGFGPFSLGANWTDNGDSGSDVGSGDESSYWNVAASFETGPVYLSASYIAKTFESTGSPDWEPAAFGLTADYTVAPGLGVYAEYTGYDSDSTPSFDASVIILGANVSF
jgi:hypothetical protein